MMMKIRNHISSFLLGKGIVRPGSLFLLAGMCNLLFLPFIHFHPGQTHAHFGHEAEHHHAGHFHSPELESLAQLVHVHSDEEDLAHHSGGHTHSSPAEESGKAFFPFVAPVNKVKVFALTQVDFDLSSSEPVLRLPGKRVHYNQVSSRPTPYFDIVPPVRGPPSI